MKLFEYILREADKSRFLKPLWDQFSDQLEDNNITYEELLDFVNKDDPLLKQQFEMRGINWQKKGSDAMLWVAIISAFNARKETNKQKEIEKAAYKAGDVISMIKSEKMLYLAGETEEATDCDFVHLPELDNDKFTFVVPMTWDACRFCDSAKMGGEGAKWCIGYEQSDSYWKEYTGNGDLFILAFNNEAFKKGKNREKDTLKYMIQLSPESSETQAWLQSDKEKDTIKIEKFDRFFGHDAVEMVTAFANRILVDDNHYSSCSQGDFYDIEAEEACYPWDDNDFIDNVLYYSDIMAGEYDNNPKIVYNKCQDNIEIDLEGHSMGDIIREKHLGMTDNQKFDYQVFCDWLTKNGVKEIHITIKNGHIPILHWEPRPVKWTSSTGCRFLWLEKMKIDILEWSDFTNGMTSALSFSKDSSLKCISWGTSKEKLKSISRKNLYLHEQCPLQEFSM